MLLLSVRSLFKITVKSSVVESILSKITGELVLAQIALLEISGSSFLTSVTGLQSGCKATTIQLLIRFFEGIWKTLRNFQ